MNKVYTIEFDDSEEKSQMFHEIRQLNNAYLEHMYLDIIAEKEFTLADIVLFSNYLENVNGQTPILNELKEMLEMIQ